MKLRSPDVIRKALPITLREFRGSLISSWELHPTWQRPPITLGLAISGGVDSMALASLCARMQDENWRFRAFVVDHGARIGSGQEAYEVAELVKKQGIETTVLKINWPKDIIPSRSSKFESLARKYRYRVLGTACRDSGARHLLLAHHEDDQYETLMMRLAKGHKGRGLLGMKASGRIPECDGIYGVYSSTATDKDLTDMPVSKLGIFKQPGESLANIDRTEPLQTCLRIELIDDRLKKQKEDYGFEELKTENMDKIHSTPPLAPMRVEQDSIRVLRPLLSYGKDRLIATCRHDRTSWFEDLTNADPTFTPRNALRHIFKKHTLPAALQKSSILALSTELSRANDLLERNALSLLDQHSAWSFAPRAGSLIIQFPKVTHLGIDEKDKLAGKPDWRDTVWRLLKNAIMAVSPIEGVQFQRLDKLSRYIYPELNLGMSQDKKRLDCFTIAGVMFQRKERNNLHLAVPGETFSEVRKHNTLRGCNRTVDMQDCGWLISRQPYESSLERQPVLDYFPSTISTDKYSGWKCYDGRYWIWIRIHDQSLSSIRVRPFREKDLQAIKKLDFRTRQRMLYLLKTIAPGPIRFTLPVIVCPKKESGEEEMILALPTLDVGVPGAERFMEYKIKYKEVEWPRPQQIGEIHDVPAPSQPKVNSLY